MTDRGTRGEKSFSLLCSDAGLICNSSEEDIAGWDFFVQFPLDTAFTGSADHRPPAISAFFQVKTSQKQFDAICIKLSNAERMAREIKPTFFALGLDCGPGSPIKFELAHVGKLAVSHILAALRKNQTLPYSKRKKTVSISRSILEITSIQSSDDLRSAIKNYSTDSIEGYIKRKIEITKTVGYNENAFKGKFALSGIDADDKLISLMIGEIDELEVQDFSVVETRFDIAVPLQEATSVILRAEPSEKQYGIVEFITKDRRHRAEFECEVRAPRLPDIDKDKFRVRVSNDIFSVIFSPSRGFYNWDCDPDTSKSLDWDQLKNLLYFLYISTLESSYMYIYLHGRKAVEAKFSSTASLNWEEASLNKTISLIDYFYKFPELRSYLKFSGNEFVKIMNNRTGLFALLRDRDRSDSVISCTLSRTPEEAVSIAKFLFPLGFQCGGRLIAMMLIVEGTPKIDGRDVRMNIKNIELDAFGSFENKSLALKSIENAAKKFASREPDSTLVVVEPSIYSEKAISSDKTI
ncbi:hypothetical protein ACLBXB_11385 [Methylobacterium mesophilicum]